MSKRQERQRFIRFYKEQTGATEIDMHEVARFAKKMGWDMPKPQSDVDMLAKLFTDDAQAEREVDKESGLPYRVYHAIPAVSQPSLFVYVDIHDAKRPQMLRSAVNRREQMVSDGYQLTLDLEQWNRLNPEEEPIKLTMDLDMDIAIRIAAQGDDDEAV
jgi:hypothetical protein